MKDNQNQSSLLQQSGLASFRSKNKNYGKQQTNEDLAG